jgi:hypothetical protein
MNRYTPAFQDHAPEALADLRELVDRNGTLELLLESSSNKHVRVVFDAYLAYRKLDEGDAMLALEQLAASAKIARTFYRVEESDFIEWFSKQSHAVRDQQKLNHYAVVTHNDVVDVISLSEPTFS